MKKFMLTFFIALLFIIGIVIIFDISEKIDDFVEHQVTLKSIVFDYYINFIPYFMNMFSPLFVFITVIFFTSRLAQNSEIIAILSCGISFHRLMVPYIVSAFLIALLSLSLNLWVIPPANLKRNEFEAKYIRYHDNKTNTRNVHYQISPGQFVFVESFSKINNTAYKFSLESVENNRLTSKLSAESAVWDSTFGGWRLRKYFLREYAQNSIYDRVRYGDKLDTVINLTVTDFLRRKDTVESQDINELNDFIDMQRMRGDATVQHSLVEWHTRFALPFSAFILTILGVSLSSRKKRGGIGWNLAAGIALSFSYILFLKFSQMFVATGTLPPWFAIWLPNIIYTIIAAVLYHLAPK
ncbi:MAG: LptF/LptG family permease [Bacteroidales bacterium]|nr:LptF/LptG family permease [Bacteroidales bacterium]